MSDINTQEIPAEAPAGSDVFGGETTASAPHTNTPADSGAAVNNPNADAVHNAPTDSAQDPTATAQPQADGAAAQTAAVQENLQQQGVPGAGMTPEQMAQIAQNVVMQNQQLQGQQAQQEPQMTQEQYDKQFNIFRTTPQHIEALQAGGEHAVAAMEDIVSGIALQANTQAQFMIQQTMDQYNQSLQPYIQMAQQAQADQKAESFFQQNPQLTGQDALITAVINTPEIQQMKQAGQNYETISAAVAERATAMLTQIRDSGGAQGAGGQQGAQVPQQGQNQQAITQPNGSRMPRTSVGGQGAVGNTGGRATIPGPTGNHVFG